MAGALLFSRDLGGANQVMGLHHLLTGGGAAPTPDLAGLLARCGGGPPTVMAKDHSIPRWRRFGVEPLEWPGDEAAALRGLLERVRPGIVITGTCDIDDRSPQRLWLASRERGIVSATLLDQAVNLVVRFLGPGEGTVFPDEIYACEPETIPKLGSIGIAGSALRLGADLHMVRLRHLAGKVPSHEIERLRREWGVPAGGRAVLFVSENQREMRLAGRGSPYDEIDHLYDVNTHFSGKGAVLVVRPHPKDTPGKYDGIPGIVLDRSPDSLVSVLAADLVVGMDSTVLVEARELGRPTVSVWTGHSDYRPLAELP